ncbi:membrane spanning protein [Oceanobacillus picturae]|uniref:Membrane spanning protein n=1 Tax=Oceanobacillus picturae TaxID=171693 RepID=A0A0U9H4W9_9BACI|nr:DUF2512 family protein [Oceanobacillus picturae]GAQ17403.1 membrane spanning protein [Oceanobacillus picturae]
MTGLLLKLIITPLGIVVSSWILPNVQFAAWYQPILLGAVLAVIGYMGELVFLGRKTKGFVLAMDFVISAVGIYIGAWVFANTGVTLLGAILTAVILVITEIFQHNWLINSGRIKKEGILR